MPEVAGKEVELSEPPQKRQCAMPLDSVVLRFAKLTEHAFTPTRGSKLAAGYDLYRYIWQFLAHTSFVFWIGLVVLTVAMQSYFYLLARIDIGCMNWKERELCIWMKTQKEVGYERPCRGAYKYRKTPKYQKATKIPENTYKYQKAMEKSISIALCDLWGTVSKGILANL